MLYAELFSGASQLWFLNPWSLLVTFPLYLFHVLFFVNLAFRTGKTSPSHFYLWGCLFGMYEAFITQVLWLGYGTQGVMWGSFFGIGLGEFLALVFFWHPVFSFMLPVFVFEVLALSVKSELSLSRRVFPSHVGFLSKTAFNSRLLYLLFFAGVGGMAANNKGNVVSVLLDLSVTYLLIWLLFKKASRSYSGDFSVRSLRVGRRGMFLISLYLLALYSAMFFGYGVLGRRVQSVEAVVSTLVLYFVFGWLLWTSKRVSGSGLVPGEIFGNCFGLRDLKRVSFFHLVLVSFFSLVYLVAAPVVFVLFSLIYLFASLGGVYLFYRAAVSRN